MMTQLEFMTGIFRDFGDFELFYVKDYDQQSKKAIPGWSSWKKYSECSEQEIEEANLRSILKQEVVLDIEEPEKFDPIIEEILRLPVTFQAYETGSRGYHIHMIFNELATMESNMVTAIKDSIIKHFDCDISKKAERNLIAIEGKPHFKTGRPKKIRYYKSKGENNLNLFLAVTTKFSRVRMSDPKLNDLYNGKWQKWGFPSRSEAEESLCSILACNNFSFDEIWNIMNGSMIGKWQEKPDSYKRLTIGKALQFAEAKKPIITEITKEPIFRYLEEYGVPQPVSWLVPGYIPARGVTIITGRPGCGKSFVTEEMISAITNGRRWFNQFDIIHKRPVILIDMENDHSTLYDRLKKLGGIPEKMLRIFNFDLNFDSGNEFFINALMKEIESMDPCLVIFDTLRRTYSGDENDSRVINMLYKQVLAPIAKERCCLLIAHTRKSGPNQNGGDDLSEIRGTGDITGLASSVLMLRPNVDKSILIKPIKLRPAQLAAPFNIRILEKDEMFIFEVTNSTAEKTEVEVISDKIFDWLKHNTEPGQIIKTRHMIENLKGHSSRSISTAIKMLYNRGILNKTQKGQYKFCYGDETLNTF